MMANHSADPVGSPFLSFTTKIDVAANFATGGSIVVAKIDPRRILPNIASRVKSEGELFVPLIVFPDEILHVQPIAGHRPEALAAVQKFVEEYKVKSPVSELTIQDGYRQFANAVSFAIKAPRCAEIWKRSSND